jgi:L-ascorbate metabolism protein UlaG (beta-lactamase superfamily)
MHYGTFPMLHGHPEQLVEKLAGSGIRVRTLERGKATSW